MAISRVIEVSFGRSSVALVRIDTAYFYNNGIIFKPADIELPASYQVHWADSPQASSTLETIGTAEGAPIPDDLWNRSRVIYGWIYLHPTEDSGITAYEVRIYKNVRAGLPDGTDPTPAEQSTIDQLIRALNGAVEQAEDAQEAIENMSVSATTLAEGESATVTKSEQDGVVHLAFGIPKGATGDDGYSPTASVTKSGKTATITITDKNGTTSAQVEDGEDGIDGISPSVSVTDITGGHRVVITDKDGAKSFDVEDGATGATPNLTIGTVETLDPTDDATATITGTAENPVLNFGIPKGEQGEVTLEDYYKAFPTDTASGAIASFTDGADDLPLKSLVIDIDPVQDLHGQDSPYPAGGGVNQWDEKVEFGYWNDANAEWRPSTQQLKSKNYIPISPSTTYRLVNPSGTISRYVYYDANKVYLSWEAATSNRDFTTPANAHYMMFGLAVTYGTEYNNDVSINYPSTDTSYHPYENICPISGWTSVGVNQFAVNVWDEELELGSFDSQGNPTTSSTYVRSKNYIPLIPNATYYFVRPSIIAWVYYYTDTDYIKYVQLGSGVKTFAPPSNATRAKFLVATSAYGATYNHDISINYPSTDHDYHHYAGHSITINLGQTVYGAKLYPLEGEAVIDRAIATIDENSDIYYWSTPVSPWYGFSYRIVSPLADPKRSTVICDRLNSSLNNMTTRWNVYTIGNVIYVCVNEEALTEPSLTGAKMWLANNPLTVVYPLATPITIQLTPNQVNSLLGVNNIWADSGDTEVEYRADTKLFIERLTAPDSADMIADANITSGKYFMVGNNLFKATANIANGSAIIVGTNAVRKSLSEALNEINA